MLIKLKVSHWWLLIILLYPSSMKLFVGSQNIHCCKLNYQHFKQIKLKSVLGLADICTLLVQSWFWWSTLTVHSDGFWLELHLHKDFFILSIWCSSGDSEGCAIGSQGLRVPTQKSYSSSETLKAFDQHQDQTRLENRWHTYYLLFSWAILEVCQKCQKHKLAWLKFLFCMCVSLFFPMCNSPL